MSEIIQRRMDYMAEEFEEIRRTKLFNNDEFRNIRLKIRSHEDKIHSVTKVLQDFKDYIRFVKELWKEIRARRSRSKSNDRIGSLEHKLIRRIKNLFETALQRFSNEISMCLEYFKFCKQVNYIDAACTAVDSMVKHHMDKPEVWQVAGAWYAYDRKNITRASEIILKGLTIHRNSTLLYTEAVKYILNTNPSSDENHQLCCEKLKTYVSEILDKITDVEYYMEVLKLLEPYEFTATVQYDFIEKILETHADKESVWHTLAQREKNGFHHKKKEDCNFNSNFSTRVSLCFAKYQEGLKRVSSSEKPILWSKYLDCVLEIRQESNSDDVVSKDFLKQVIEQACKEMCLPENYFIIWLDLVDDKEALNVMEKAVNAFPNSVELWNLWLKYNILKDDPDQVNKVFEAGVAALEEKALPLWLAVIRYHVLISQDDTVESLYKKGIKQPQEVSVELKIHYIEWLALNKDLKSARVEYNCLAREKPYCKELHKTMAKLESTSIRYNLDEWRNVYELAWSQFEEDPDVYIDYVYFYIHFNKSPDLNEHLLRIYKRAESKLSPLDMAYFTQKYNDMLATM